MLIDTYAWVEFFRGTERGKAARKTLKAEKCYISVVTVAELVEWCLKNDLGARIEEYAREIARSSVLLGLDEQIAMLAGKVNYDRKKTARGWGMMDSLILATAVSYNLNILTGDSHFRDLPNAKML